MTCTPRNPTAVLAVITAGLVLAMPSPVALAEPSIIGVWRTIDDRDGRPRGLVEIKPEGSAFTGRIIASLRGEPDTKLCTACRGSLQNKPLKNLAVVTGLRKASSRTFEGGRILDPDTGQIVDARAEVAPDGRSLVMRGYLGLSFIGRSQRWERVR